MKNANEANTSDYKDLIHVRANWFILIKEIPLSVVRKTAGFL